MDDEGISGLAKASHASFNRTVGRSHFASAHCVDGDFAQGFSRPAWRAVHIGVFKVEPLSDAVNKRWLEEDCPGRRIPEDEKAGANARHIEPIFKLKPTPT
jgi:hypothetical protein